ncbi:ArsR/SmtB family transcription factor [Actinomadura parmotrematis]|uniref:Helix-turn-helix domain-containing protein n=1 Tax=Actinomadura parmotrematis TaxID=2864039 RepID=A0ABS7G3L7_9ACTN|nr:helix-turn-helix domain-containing protein [Actinomadura parmotrematis]MBW8487312.1 helix-turn-helix domain-containing protein [Actinomadura parmotrematis]
MGWWQINADTLAGSRFTVSPLSETIACLITLHRDRAVHPGERAWLHTHRAAYRDRLTADPVTARLVTAAFGPDWNADFITPTPTGEDAPDFDRELDVLRAAPPAAARHDLLRSLRGPLPDALDRDDLPHRAADLLAWVWERTVRPDWTRRRHVLEADIVARTSRLGRGGWAAALDGLRPGMRWLGGDRLRTNMGDYPPRELAGVQLLLVPVTPSQGRWTSWEGTGRYALTYPCSGTLAERPAAAPAPLARLLGPHRAAALVLLADPKSTTQLVALTGQTLGSVGRHLRVLLDAGLVERRRTGRSVLYYRTDAGDAVVRAAG